MAIMSFIRAYAVYRKTCPTDVDVASSGVGAVSSDVGMVVCVTAVPKISMAVGVVESAVDNLRLGN